MANRISVVLLALFVVSTLAACSWKEKESCDVKDGTEKFCGGASGTDTGLVCGADKGSCINLYSSGKGKKCRQGIECKSGYYCKFDSSNAEDGKCASLLGNKKECDTFSGDEPCKLGYICNVDDNSKGKCMKMYSGKSGDTVSQTALCKPYLAMSDKKCSDSGKSNCGGSMLKLCGDTCVKLGKESCYKHLVSANSAQRKKPKDLRGAIRADYDFANCIKSKSGAYKKGSFRWGIDVYETAFLVLFLLWTVFCIVCGLALFMAIKQQKAGGGAAASGGNDLSKPMNQ